MKTVIEREKGTNEKNFWRIPAEVVKVYKSNDNYLINQLTDSTLLKNHDDLIKDFAGVLNEKEENYMSSDLRQLFNDNEKIKNAFDELPEYNKRQYILWIESSLNDDIRQERIARLVRIFSQRFGSL